MIVADSYLRNLSNAPNVSVLATVFRVVLESSIIQPFAHPIRLCFSLNLLPNVVSRDFHCRDFSERVESLFVFYQHFK